MKERFLLIAILTGLFLIPLTTHAQQFGQNKPRYRSFDFNVLETPHYSIHYYTKNKEVLQQMADWSEMWYDMHSEVLQDTYDVKNPIIFYNNHAEFQQTNAIYGDIGVGTGGVTEGFKNRVVLPFTMINQQNQHVLGHELVHSFQYHMIIVDGRRPGGIFVDWTRRPIHSDVDPGCGHQYRCPEYQEAFGI
jgi:hypothetical protein